MAAPAAAASAARGRRGADCSTSPSRTTTTPSCCRHWTEPATGQVPKVVIDAEDEPVSGTTGQPRWRDEGERTSETRFDDLVGEGPSLGVLGDQSEPSYTEDDFFEREVDHDPLEAFARRGGGVRIAEALADPRARGGHRRAGVAAAQRRQRRPQPADGGGGRRRPRRRGAPRFKFGTITTMLLAAVIIGVASFEFFTAVREVGYNPATLVGMVATVSLPIGASSRAWPPTRWCSASRDRGAGPGICSVSPGEGPVPNLAITLLGVMWIGMLGSFAGCSSASARWCTTGATRSTGIGVLIAAVVAAVAYDVGGYFIGRQSGTRRCRPPAPTRPWRASSGAWSCSLVVAIVVGDASISARGTASRRALVFGLVVRHRRAGRRPVRVVR